MKKQTKGIKYPIMFDHGKETFTAGGRRRVALGDGMVIVNGRVRLADGTECYALLEIDESSSGEHCGTAIMTESGVWFSDEARFLKRIGKTKDQVYPYSYKYDAALRCHDHHVGDDGWSR
jgi:hypothetical protein